MTSVTIPNSVESIGYRAFYSCDGLTSVTIGNSVTSIGYEAFAFCSGLTSVTIPNSVTSIGGETFAGCSGLTSIVVESGNSVYDSRNNCNAIIETATNTLHSGCQTTLIPNSVTSIGDYAFYYCSGLTSVTIPNSVTSIGAGAFENCSGLTSVTIPNSVTSIGYCAFCACEGLTSVTIPNSVTSIEEGAFYKCSGLTSVTIGSGVQFIGIEAFGKCPNLLDVYCYAENVPYTESDAFEESPITNATLHVPAGSVESYNATEPWSSFGKIVGLSAGEPEQPDVEKCATPVVTYAEGKLSFSCETEGANYVTKLVAEDAKEYYDAEIELSATYNIEVYATKANYDNSDTVSVALVWVENGDTDVETGIISVPAAPVLIQGNGGVLSVSGLAKDTEVVVYTISGTEVARATATDGTATISTGLQSGTIVVVKFGNKSVKVRI